MSDHVVFALAGVGSMHIKGKGCGKGSYHFQHGDDQPQLRLAEMHNLLSGLQFRRFNELGGSKVLALA